MRALMHARAIAALLSLSLVAACGGGAADRADTAAGVADTAAQPSTAAPADTAAVADTTGHSAMLDPNTATREQLIAIPGMSPAAADALLAGRTYQTMLDVDRALSSHLSREQRTQVYATLWKPIDLNTASGDEILLIPGVGNRMKHEFEEYRPYRSIAQFRREIGKYVNEAEVARLERYVAIR